jgi:hypothetical protein
MAYIPQPKYPSKKKPGVYPSGSIKELGLNTDNLEKFSLGSWEEVSLSSQRFIFQDIFTNTPVLTVQDGLDNFTKEDLFGFAYVADDDTNITINDINGKTKLINYDKNKSPDKYKESSIPVKVNFGMDFKPDSSPFNFDQNQSGTSDTILIGDGDVDTVSTQETTQLDGTPSQFWENNEPEVWADRWNIGYLNYKNPGNPVPEEITPIVLNHESTPFIIKWNTFGIPEDGDGPNRYLLPNGAYRIEFTTPILKTDFPIKILDRVKLFSYWDHEYNVIDIKGTLTHIEAIQLDVVYPGDISADAVAQKNGTLGFLSGEDWLDLNPATNKVMYLPSPFELRAGAGEAGSFDSEDVYFNNEDSPQFLNESYLAEAYTWGNQNSEVDNMASTKYSGTPVMRSEDMPESYNIVIRRPKSSAAESKFGFTKLEFEEDDIKTKDGDVELSLFKEPIPRSPRQLSEDIPPSLEEKTYTYSDGGATTYDELIGFRQPNNNWSGTDINAVAVTNEPIAKNVIMRARHGYYESGFPPNANNNSNAGGKQWSGNIGDNANDRFPILSKRAAKADEDGQFGYPTISWLKDSEFVFYPAQEIPTLEFETNTYYRVKFNIRIKRKSGNDNYDLKVGVGVLDTSTDAQVDGTVYDIKTLTNTHLETNVNDITANEWVEYSFSGAIFTSLLPVDTLQGIPYITINSRDDTSAGSFPTPVNNTFIFQIMSYKLETLDVITEGLLESIATSQGALYKYKVIQWGDEKQKLTTEQLLNTFYLSWYKTESETSDWVKKQYARKASREVQFIKHESTGYLNLTSHVYNTSGLKSIKSIVYRVNSTESDVFESKIITTNIVINDGNLTSQDFSIFGGTDFNFLPLKDNEVIIGGLNEDSKYNNSVEKIKKDDNFIQDDYLERQSSRDFIDNFNKKLYGESPGQLDLSTTRMYKKPLDIYDFITDDKQSIVDNNFNINTLPINSSATDIFISNNDCIVDLNPQDVEYLSIQNKTGTADKAILIGDYKVNQPKDGKIQRQGVMETPLLEQNTDKQAF